MSCKHLGEFSRDHNHEEDLSECCVALPGWIRRLSEDDVLSIDTTPPEEEPEALEAENGLAVGQEGMEKLCQDLTMMMVMQLHYKNNQADYAMYLQKEANLRQNLYLSFRKLI